MLDGLKLVLIYCIVESRDMLYMLQQYFMCSRRYRSFLDKIPRYDITQTTDGYILERVYEVPPPSET